MSCYYSLVGGITLMKLITLKCPECGATLNLDGSRKEYFCTYCGAKILLDEEIQRQDIKIENRIVDEAAIEKEKTKQEKQKWDFLAGFIALILLFIVTIILNMK